MTPQPRFPGRAGPWFRAMVAVLAVAVAGCHQSQLPVASGPSGAPSPPPAGWRYDIRTPSSQREAQDTVVGYLKQTLAALPAGTVVDSYRYGGPVHAVPCSDAPNSPPVQFSLIASIEPPDEDYESVIPAVGKAWKQLGWWVFEREDLRTPNRFGYPPDGYVLHVRVAARPGYAPTITATSPCFPHDLARDAPPFPKVITG